MNYKKIIIQWKEFKVPSTKSRNQKINLNSELITTVIGPRRAGKTYLCFNKIKELLDRGVPKDNIFYINFEDEKLVGADAEDLDKLYEFFLELSDVDENKEKYLFLDEIQNVENWDIWVRRMHDMHKDLYLIVTGSSSKLLSTEISTKLRGRVKPIKVFPLSFSEFLLWRNIKIDIKKDAYGKKKNLIKKEFNKYLSQSGYPLLSVNKSLSSKSILQQYFNSMILKDIIERHNIREVKKLKIIARFIFQSVASQISYNKLANKMKSLGFKISKNSIIDYLSYFEDAYLFFQNMKYDYSLTKQIGSIKKVYCIDNGLLNYISFKFSKDKGKLLENTLYIELRRRNKEIYYHKDKKECDFLIKEKDEIIEAIQVCYNLDQENKKREIDGLLEAMNKFNLNKGFLFTYDQEDKLKIDGKEIIIKPLWKYLLE